MAKKIAMLDQLKWIGLTGLTSAGFCYAGTYSLEALGFRVPQELFDAAPAIGLTATFGYWTLYQLDMLRDKPRKPTQQFAFTAAGLTPTASPDPDTKSWLLRWKPEQPVTEEFIYTGLGLPMDLAESRFRELIGIARRRQTAALHGKTLHRTSGGAFRRVKLNWVLSQNYFVRERRYSPVEYQAFIEVLGWTRLLTGRRGQGTSGWLVGDYGENRYCDLARDRWIRLVEGQFRKPVSRWGKVKKLLN